IFRFCVVFHDKFFRWFCFCSSGLKHLESDFGTESVALMVESNEINKFWLALLDENIVGVHWNNQ
ncbi:hypothetical protein S245_037438, partial [Arachis hypogaea]